MATDQPPSDHPLAASQPWYRRLYDEAGPKANYGFAIYYLPRVVEADGLKIVQDYHNWYIDRAKSLIRSDTAIGGPRFRLQPMLWPLSSTEEAGNVSKVTSRSTDISLQSQQEPKHFIDEIEEQVTLPTSTPRIRHTNTRPLDGINADETLVSTFQHLREHFRAFRSLPRPAYRGPSGNPASEDYGRIKPGEYEGLMAGILDNVFIVVNENSAYTWWGEGGQMPCDRAWMWAVDPDFEDDKSSSISGNGLHEQYRGYVRVRLQQLTNWFYEARRFRPDVTFQDLWDAARQSSQYSFVSLNPEQYHASEVLSSVGSALRPTLATGA